MYISDEAVLQMERARSKAVSYLQNLGYTIDNDANWSDMNLLLSNMTQNEIIRKLLNGSISGEYVDDEITYLKSYAFTDCNALTSIKIDNVTYIKGFAFYGISGLKKPLVLYNTNSAQNQISGFTSPVPVIFKNLVIGESPYKSGVISPIMDYQGNRTINNNISNITLVGFLGKTLIMRSETPSTLSSVSYIPSSVTEIYVPSNLIDTYKNMTNWSTIPDKLKAIEGSEYEDLEWYKDWTL